VRRIPFGLTLATFLAFTLIAGLGAWQLHRLAWKQALLAKIEALNHAPARPLDAVAAAPGFPGEDEFVRVSARCLPTGAAAAPAYRYALRDGAVGWRLLSPCRLTAGPYDGVLLDRGLVRRFTGAMAPGEGVFPPASAVTGVLRRVGGPPLLGANPVTAGGPEVVRVLDRAALVRILGRAGVRRPVPYLLAVEAETPQPPGLQPAALPQDVPNNHFVYALTWFALAGILLWFYGAMLLRRLRTP
jgi:surfeit locus 1 family protein